MRIMRRYIYVVCICAATLLLFAPLLCKNAAVPARFSSAHAAATMAPLMGFPADSLVNCGDAKALDALPGVGEVISQRILNARIELNGFRLPEDLLLVKGIGEKTLEKIMLILRESLVPLPELPE